MIIAYDVETQGLNCQNFLAGDIYTEDHKHFTFTKKEELWSKILDLAEKEKARKKNLIVYAHNAIYDYFAVVPLPEPESVVYCDFPFIAQRGNIKFYDTMGLYRKGLDKVGEQLGKPKIPTPGWLKKESHSPTREEWSEMILYLRRDTELVMESVISLKAVLQTEGLRPRHIVTIGQIGINYACKLLKKSPYSHLIFDQGRTSSGVPLAAYNRFWPCINKDIVHKAYRGGRVLAYRTGRFKTTTMIDKNSFYAWCTTAVPFPDLRTETLIEKPLKNGWDLPTLISKFGMSTCLVEINPKKPLGILPIRQRGETSYPIGKKLLIGTWTHLELLHAVKLGCRIHHIHHSVVWETLPSNPLAEVMTELWKKRKESTGYEKQLYKDIMNNITGKFGQRREYKVTKYASVDEVHKLAEEGYQPIHAVGTDYVYQKSLGVEHKGYYAPIIVAYITAMSRTTLYDEMMNLPPSDIIYNDTDSILFRHSPEAMKRFIYGPGLGEWKVQQFKQPALVYGKKTYSVGSDIRMSGVSRGWLDADDFDKGLVTYKRMRTMRTATSLTDVGTFEKVSVDLREKHLKEEPDEEEEPHLLIDSEDKSLLPDFVEELPKSVLEDGW